MVDKHVVHAGNFNPRHMTNHAFDLADLAHELTTTDSLSVANIERVASQTNMIVVGRVLNQRFVRVVACDTA